MTLENFRAVNLKIDRANGSFLSDQFAKAGDYNGRRLVVQLSNAGVVGDLTGVDVNLGWQHDTLKNTGLDPFEPVDLTQGIFEIYYPKEMLTNGNVTALIQIIENDHITETKNFKIKVEKSVIDEDTIVSENSFTVLQDALLTVNRYDSRIANVENSKVDKSTFEQSTNNLTAQLQQTEQNLSSQLAHMEIEVFNEIPSTTQLKEGKFGFVIDVAQQKYDELNLSFEDLNVNGFPKGFTNYPSGTGLPINETHLSTIASTDGTFRSQRLGMVGGVDGSSNYSRLRSAIVIPLNNSRLIKKSDLMNFRFSIKPLSNGCFDGNGKHFGALDVSFRDSENQVLGNSLTTNFIYDSFVLPGNTKDSKVPGNEWSIIKWDLYSHIKETSINFDAVENISLTFLAYTNHSSASVEYLIDDISFGV